MKGTDADPFLKIWKFTLSQTKYNTKRDIENYARKCFWFSWLAKISVNNLPENNDKKSLIQLVSNILMKMIQTPGLIKNTFEFQFEYTTISDSLGIANNALYFDKVFFMLRITNDVQVWL